MPEEAVQTDVHAGVMGDRHHHGEVARAVHRASDELPGYLGVARGALGEREVEHRDARRREHLAAGAQWQRERVCGLLPGTEQIPGSEQLRAESPVDPHAADEEPLENQ